MIPVLLLTYVVLAGLVVFVSIKCADYVDLIDKKTKLAGAFIGGVILAAITSMPELITSISAITISKEPGLVVGNVLGSNMFNLCVLSLMTLLFLKKAMGTSISKSHVATSLCSIGAYFFVAIVCLLGIEFEIPVINVSYVSIAILTFYMISLKFLSGTSSPEQPKEEEEQIDDSDLTVKQIVVRFIMCACVLIPSSVGITLVTNELSSLLEFDASLAGALFLGIATSLPELSSSFALAKKGNFNAMTGNILGSNMFNFLVFTLSDVMLVVGSIYSSNVTNETKSLVGFGVIASLLTVIFLCLQQKEKKPKGAIIPLCSGVLLCYAGFLIVA